MAGARWLPAALLIAGMSCTAETSVTCASCTINRVPVVRLDFRDAPASPDAAPKVLPLADDRGYLVAPVSSSEDLFLFDKDGRFVRSIGRPGAGPEEHRAIRALLQDATDSIWVFDSGNQKADVYTPLVEHARSLSVTGRIFRAAAIPDGRILLQGSPGDPSIRDQHTWVLDRKGGVRPFAATSPGEEGSDGLESMALNGPDAAWVVEGHRYAVVLLSLSGDTIRVIGSAPEWFKTSAEADRFEGMMDLRPAVLDIMQSQGNTLWMMVGVPEDQLPDPASVGDLPPEQIVDLFVDHVLVAMDSRDGTPLSEMRFEYLPASFVGPGMMAAVEDDETGERWIQIYRLELNGRT